MGNRGQRTLFANELVAGQAVMHNRARQSAPRLQASRRKERFWRAMVSMRLTTRQKSGPRATWHGSSLESVSPYVPTVHQAPRCRRPDHAKVLRKAGRIRSPNARSRPARPEPGDSRRWLVDRHARPVQSADAVGARDVEIEVRARSGPLPRLRTEAVPQPVAVAGLTRYEIPIDSRLTDWLNEFRFPECARRLALGDDNYYRFISDGIQTLRAQRCTAPVSSTRRCSRREFGGVDR